MSIWNMAADVFDFDDDHINDVLYCNSNIEDFLKAETSMGISAGKGMGKTFLLKAKRLKLMKDQSILIFPKNKLVDIPAPIVLQKSQIKFLESYENWSALWVFCISAFLLSQEELKKHILPNDLDNFSNEIKEIITTQNEGVFHVLNRLLSYNNVKILRDAVLASQVIFYPLNRIQQSVILFVDKLEEPFNRGYYRIDGSTDSNEGKYNKSIWAYAQLSFADAVYKLYAGRHHVKIYFSIREEALYGGENISTNFSKISGELITRISYDYNDLKLMFEKYIFMEDKNNLYDPSNRIKNPGKALCGITKILHRTGKYETLWDYMYRHSLGRPRDIMEMGKSIYKNIVEKCNQGVKMSQQERVFTCRHWINQCSTRICMEHMYYLEPFMGMDENIVFSRTVERFLSVLPTNVFTVESATKYCHIANNNQDDIDCANCNYNHFFSALYNIGLLGYIYESTSQKGVYKNSIKNIAECKFEIKEQTLPKGELYYVHPGIGNMIKEIREREMNIYVSSNIIINSSQILVERTQLMELKHMANALLGNINKHRVFLSSTDRDLGEERKRIIDFLEQKGYEVMAFEEPGFPPMPLYSEGLGATHDHCVDVALSCSRVIYIVGNYFGGKYSGKDYRYYIEKYNNVIKINPSISFMEYLVSKNYNKNVNVYVLEELDNRRIEYIIEKKSNNSVEISDNDKKVFEQIRYFNALGNGTWYNKYSDIDNLLTYLDAEFPDIN